MRRKTITRICLLGLALFLLVTYLANRKIEKESEQYIYSDINKVKFEKTGLLLGTGKLLRNGSRNEYFFNRIEAARQLYENKKIKYIIISGDNSRVGYDEPSDMKNELVALGIPDSVIFLDYAGFRTFDSVIRAKEIFGQESFIVISQEFHNERAVFIARQNAIRAYGYNAKAVNAYSGFKTNLREFLARDKVFVDNLIGTTPKFLGDKIVIE